MEYINVERNTYDGNDCDEKCYYGIVCNVNDKIELHDVVFGKSSALRFYRNIKVDIKDEKKKVLEYPSHYYSLIKISSRLGVQFVKDRSEGITISPIVTLKLTQFGELYGDVTISGDCYAEQRTKA